jgi:exodeoxyribonuclease V beta subunit
MPTKKEIQPFDAKTVPLQQSNLIQASAGTGKTYSIAILSLRLLLEQNIPVQEILMVTFTKAAVAELETRIRAFVRQAHDASMGKKISDETIAGIVDTSIAAIGKSETEYRLNTAVLFLDETAILTIHGFCQRVLAEYAFETSQLFGADTMSETDLIDVTNNEVNNFWRKNIVVLQPELLQYIMPTYFTRNQLLEFVKNALGGKKLVALSAYTDDVLSTQNQLELLQQLQEQNELATAAFAIAASYIELNREALLAAVMANKNAEKKFAAIFNDTDALIDEILASKTTQYVAKIFMEVLRLLEPASNAEEAIRQLLFVFTNKLYQLAIDTVCSKVQASKERNSLLAFDDMIIKLHHAVVIRQNKVLIEALKQKYKAVFIDEFQDTDKLQYEVFNGLFGSGTILFYIGDPKQSIYAWRKADILTYFKAFNEVVNRYEMNTNYRSGNGIIKAQNSFFKPKKNFDTFYFDGADDAIEYTMVDAPENNEKGSLQLNGEPVIPISIFENKNNGEIIAAVAATVIDLLGNADYALVEKNISRRVRPSDIGILVRNKYHGKDIKDLLASFKIPAVTIDDTKLSDTEEAKELLYVLQAVNDINASNIHKALLTGLTGYKINNIVNLNEEQVLNQFKTYQQSWASEGVYVMLMKFITDYKVRTQLLRGETANGERRLSNLLQLQELLHKIQVSKQYAAIELISWLQKAMEGQLAEGDEFEQRIESDEDAVKIVTIHKSKGLEYNIVMAPFLDMIQEIRDVASFKDEISGDYLFANKPVLTPAQEVIINTQQEQENRRLIYVAITRAKYKCYININLAGKFNNSSLKAFTKIILKTIPDGIALEAVPPLFYGYRFNDDKESFPVEFKKANNFILEQLNWHKMSYTFLNPEHSPIQKTNTGGLKDAYSEFVFSTLKKGAYTGNLLHYIFEYINFADSSQWPVIIANGLKRLSPGNTDLYVEKLLELLQEVTSTILICNGQSFSLNQISNNQCLNEFEFNFTVKPFQAQQINALSTDKVPLQVKSYQQLEGIMNGKMDLFFERDGKYYILDWKSNYLGDTLSAYDTANVRQAMADNNYHLQYHIYTVAICKYLAMRIPEFNYETQFGGVIYLFVRGMRKDASTGVFFVKPDKAVIKGLSDCLSANLHAANP